MARSPLDIDALREGATPSRASMARTVFALSLPAILAELSSTLMQYIDASMVGSLGAHASAAIGVMESTMWLLGGLAMSATMGFTVQVAQLVGAGRDADARNVLRQSIVVLTVFGVLLFAIGHAAAGSLPRWLGADPELWTDASHYLSICSIMLIPMALARLGTGMLQCSGDMLTPSVLNVLSCVLDVCFNALLIPKPWSLSLGALTLRRRVRCSRRQSRRCCCCGSPARARSAWRFASEACGCLDARRSAPPGACAGLSSWSVSC